MDKIPTYYDEASALIRTIRLAIAKGENRISIATVLQAIERMTDAHKRDFDRISEQVSAVGRALAS